jgi:hypothetical protein
MQETDPVFMNREERERHERYRRTVYAKPQRVIKHEPQTEPND